MKNQMQELIQKNVDTVLTEKAPFSIALDVATTKGHSIQSNVGLDTVRESLLNSLNKRFAYIVQFDNEGFIPKYVISTLLDPMTACTLDVDRAILVKMIKEMVRNFYKI